MKKERQAMQDFIEEFFNKTIKEEIKEKDYDLDSLTYLFTTNPEDTHTDWSRFSAEPYPFQFTTVSPSEAKPKIDVIDLDDYLVFNYKEDGVIFYAIYDFEQMREFKPFTSIEDFLIDIDYFR